MVSKARINLIFFFFMVLFTTVIITLFRVQIIDHEEYVKRGNKQFKSREKLYAKRGHIFDVQLEKLAFNERSYDVKLELKKFFEDSNHLAHESYIPTVLKLNISQFKKRLETERKRKRHTILIKRQVNEVDWAVLQEKHISGLYADVKHSRSYHQFANNLVGFTDIDNKGIAGLEYQFDELLKGKDGFREVQKDGKNHKFSHIDYISQPAEHGKNLQLTVDLYHQSVLEKELIYGLKKYNAKSVSGVIMDPFTGEIKAMASFPKYETGSDNVRNIARNRVITDAYEPGSTFKMITAAAVLEEDVASPTDIIYCENGRYKFGGRYYRDDTHKYGNLTMREVIEKSSNIGTIKLATRIGETKLFRYIRDFGFGMRTDIGLNGEATGILRKPSDWTRTSISSISIGHEISTSVLQMAQAYSVIANGGVLVRPWIIKATLDDELHPIDSFEGYKVRRVLSQATADTVRSFLYSVVKRGTAKGVYQKDLKIAGKTGTAQKLDPKTGTYVKGGKVFASFAGFFPYESPKYVVIITVDEPNYKYLNYGSQTAAPIFKKVAVQLMNTIEKEESISESLSKEQLVYVPDFIGMRTVDAEALLKKKNLYYDITGEGEFIISQTPKHKLYELSEIERIDLVASDLKEQIMPNVVGLTLREAFRKISHLRLQVEIVGSGVVYKQSIRAKTKLNQQSSIKLYCK